MRDHKSMLLVLAIVCAGVTLTLVAGETPAEHGMLLPAELTWQDGPPSLPRGAEFAMLEGHPGKPGLFTLRLRLPDGYQVPPHSHPAVERVTVISGTLHFGMGTTFDISQARALTAGSFVFMPPGMQHFVWASGETVVQLNGEGPWDIAYVNAADDPRRTKQSER